MRNWITAQNAATFVQLISTVVLVLVTIRYAPSTAHIANETKQLVDSTKNLASATEEMAASTAAMARATEQQRRDATRPIIVFTLLEAATGSLPRDFKVHFKNAGVGSAPELRLDIIGRRLPYLGVAIALAG